MIAVEQVGSIEPIGMVGVGQVKVFIGMGV